MRRFQFTLEPALQLRRRLEEQAQIELAEQQRRLEHENSRAEALHGELRRDEERRTHLQRRSISIQELAQAEQYARSLIQAVEVQEQRVQEATEQLEACRQTLQNRRTDRETLERLRERRLSEHRAGELRSEQQALDDASILRWRRSGG
jgi:flagellar FliJ protein